MVQRIHIYIYYDLAHQIYNHIDVRQTLNITREVCIISDQKIVKEILSNATTSINEFGEITNYDYKLIHQVITLDHNKYKSTYENIFYDIESIYYAKCEIVKKCDDKIYELIGEINV